MRLDHALQNRQFAVLARQLGWLVLPAPCVLAMIGGVKGGYE
jgi:hypothetical protein